MIKNSLICHNAQFEHKWLLYNGYNVDIVHDTKILAHLVDERLPLDLESLCLYFGIDKSYKCGSAVLDLEGIPLLERNTRDAYNTFKLYEVLYPKLSREEKNIYHKVLIPATKTLAKIELAGIQVDEKLLPEIRQKIEKEIQEIDLQNDKTIQEFNVFSQKMFNVNSTIHKKLLIYDILNYKIIKRNKTGEPSVDANTLKALLLKEHKENKHKSGNNCETCKKQTLYKIVATSSLQGYLENFLNPLPKYIVDGKIYPNLWLAETSSGRIKSNNPNMQNSPKDYPRQVFISSYPDGVLSEIDYTGIELKLMACLAQDEVLLKGFLEGDPHRDTASLIFNKKEISKSERDIAKTFNYGLIYGAGGYRLSLLTGINRFQINKMLEKYWEVHGCIKTYWENWVKGDLVYSPTGMKRHWTKETEAKNFPIQNSAFILMLQGLNRLVEFVEKTKAGKVCLTVHDSFVIDWESEKSARKYLPECIGIVCKHNMDWITIPITVDTKIGKNWYETEAL